MTEKSQTDDAAQAVGMRAALECAQKIIERDYPNGQLAIDIRAALAARPPAAPVNDSVAQRKEHSEPDEGRKDVGSTPITVDPDVERVAIAIVNQWREGGWDKASANERYDGILEARAAIAAMRSHSRSSADNDDRLRCRQKLEAEYNDLIYLQDTGSDSIPLSKAMDIAELGLSFIDAHTEPQEAPLTQQEVTDVIAWAKEHDLPTPLALFAHFKMSRRTSPMPRPELGGEG